MGLLDIFRASDPPARVEPSVALPAVPVKAWGGEGAIFSGFNDPLFHEFMRDGGGALTQSGARVTARMAMRNPTFLRCVSLIAFSIGMLPLHLMDKATKAKADDHPLFRVLHRRPNAWQTAFEFRSLMQQRALQHEEACALIVRGGDRRILQLVPIHPDRIQPRQRSDWSLEFIYDRPNGGRVTLPQRDVFHLRYGLSDDGIRGLSLVQQAAEAIGLGAQLEAAAARLFRNGTLAGGRLETPTRLSPEAYQRLQESLDSRRGAENAHRDFILEEGLKYTPGGQSGREAQGVEQRKHQIEEIARVFGVPRPLLGVDDTSWGSGIDVLGQFFVRYALNPWFEAWQQAIERSLLTEAEADRYEAKFNAGALLRGSMKDQAEFFAKGLGAGGHTPWLHPDEPREWMDLPPRSDLPAAMGSQPTGGADEPPQAP